MVDCNLSRRGIVLGRENLAEATGLNLAFSGRLRHHCDAALY
jgi:hypothetical protein